MSYKVVPVGDGEYPIVLTKDVEELYEVPEYANTAVLRAGFVASDYWLILEGNAVTNLNPAAIHNKFLLPWTEGLDFVHRTGLPDPTPEELNDPANWVPRILPNLTFVGAEALSHKYDPTVARDTQLSEGPKHHYLCHFRDARHHFHDIKINRAYNVVASVQYDPNGFPKQTINYHPNTIHLTGPNADKPYTWEEVLEDLLSYLPQLKDEEDADVDAISIEPVVMSNEASDDDTEIGGFIAPNRPNPHVLETEDYPIQTGHNNDSYLPRYPVDLKFHHVGVMDAIAHVLSITGHTLAVTKDNTFQVVPVECPRSLVSRLNPLNDEVEAPTESITPDVLNDLIIGRLPHSPFLSGNRQALPPLGRVSTERRKLLPHKFKVLFEAFAVPPREDNSPVPQDIYAYEGSRYCVEIDTARLIAEDPLGELDYGIANTGVTETLLVKAYKHWPDPTAKRSLCLTATASSTVSSSTAVPLTAGSVEMMGFFQDTETLTAPTSLTQPSPGVAVTSGDRVYAIHNGTNWVLDQKATSLTKNRSYLLMREAARDMVYREIASRVSEASSYEFPLYPLVYPDQLYPVVRMDFDERATSIIYTSTNLFASVWTEQDELYVAVPLSLQEDGGPPVPKWALGEIENDTDTERLGEVTLHTVNVTDGEGVTAVESEAWTDPVAFANLSGGTLTSGTMVRLDWDYALQRWVALPQGGVGSEYDPDSSCTPAKALNLTGRPVPPGHIMYVESDVTELDMTQLYPVTEGGDISIVHVDATFYTANSGTLDLSSLGLAADDLVVLMSTYNIPARCGLGTTFFDSFTEEPILAQRVATSVPIVGCWYDQLPSGQLPWACSSGAASITRGILLVLRGVKRWPTDGENLTPTKNHGLIVNGLPSFQYLFFDTFFSFASPQAMVAYTTSGTSPQGVQYDSGSALPESGQDVTYVFPKGTRFLMAYSVWGTASGSYVIPGGDWYPDDDDFIAEAKTGAPALPNDLRIAAFLTPPLGEPSVAVPSAWLAKFADRDALGGRDALSVIPLIPTPEDPAVYPAIPCDPLLCTEYLRAASLTANTTAAKREARKQLDKAKRRNIVIVKKETLEPFDTGTVIRDGYFKVWAYRRNLTDRFIGPPPENRTRTLIYDSPLSGEVGKLGRYYRSPAAKLAAALSGGDIDPRVECFNWRPDIGVSCAEPNLLEVIKWGRDDATQPGEITVTVNAKKTSESGTAMVGEWISYQLSTGANIANTTDWGFNSSGPVFSTNDIYIDLTQDADTLAKILYGNIGDVNTYTSTSGLFTATLFKRRWLKVTPVKAAWLGGLVDIDDPQDDTFVFTDDALELVTPDFAPMYYVNPETGQFGTVVESSPGPGEITYAEWPETPWPVPKSQVPDGTDIVDVPEGFDPYLGRVPGSVEGLEEFDYRTGLQLALVKFRDPPTGGGGCC